MPGAAPGAVPAFAGFARLLLPWDGRRYDETVFWGPMALAIMGGLTVATLITIFFVPVLYAAVFKVRRTAPSPTPAPADATPAPAA